MQFYFYKKANVGDVGSEKKKKEANQRRKLIKRRNCFSSSTQTYPSVEKIGLGYAGGGPNLLPRAVAPTFRSIARAPNIII